MRVILELVNLAEYLARKACVFIVFGGEGYYFVFLGFGFCGGFLCFLFSPFSRLIGFLFSLCLSFLGSFNILITAVHHKRSLHCCGCFFADNGVCRINFIKRIFIFQPRLFICIAENLVHFRLCTVFLRSLFHFFLVCKIVSFFKYAFYFKLSEQILLFILF